MRASPQAPASLAVSGFIWQRVVKPTQRSLHFFQDVLAGALLRAFEDSPVV